eukprot:scaffold840_cov179-Ochromonas_danica.AAC.4
MARHPLRMTTPLLLLPLKNPVEVILLLVVTSWIDRLSVITALVCSARLPRSCLALSDPKATSRFGSFSAIREGELGLLDNDGALEPLQHSEVSNSHFSTFLCEEVGFALGQKEVYQSSRKASKAIIPVKMNVNIEGADRIVGEYLIYRGFTQTLQSLESESHRDRTKKFEVIRIVEVRPKISLTASHHIDSIPHNVTLTLSY